MPIGWQPCRYCRDSFRFHSVVSTIVIRSAVTVSNRSSLSLFRSNNRFLRAFIGSSSINNNKQRFFWTRQQLLLPTIGRSFSLPKTVFVFSLLEDKSSSYSNRNSWRKIPQRNISAPSDGSNSINNNNSNKKTSSDSLQFGSELSNFLSAWGKRDDVDKDNLLSPLQSGIDTKTLAESEFVYETSKEAPSSEASSSWDPFHYAPGVLRRSLSQLAVLRQKSMTQNQEHQQQQLLQITSTKIRIIKDCFLVLDRLAEAMPKEDYYATTLMFQTPAEPRANEYSNHPWENTSEEELPNNNNVYAKILNDLLHKWSLAWKEYRQQQQQDYQQRRRTNRHHRTTIPPSPTQVAEHIDRYRLSFLLHPEPSAYNVLLRAMIHDYTINSNEHQHQRRIKAVQMADYYLESLVKASTTAHRDKKPLMISFVDTTSINTVIQGWVNVGQAQKAQEWFDRIFRLPPDLKDSSNHSNDSTNNTLSLLPNAVTFATLIDGWAKRGNAIQAEAVLEEAIKTVLYQINSPAPASIATTITDDSRTIINSINAVVFHTVLDAWATAAAKQNNDTSNASRNIRERQLPAIRAKALVQTMDELADEHPLWLDHLRPNDETWHKLISVVAAVTKRTPETESEVGPRAAETLLLEFEDKSTSTSPAILWNRILQAYCLSGIDMEEAEAFYHRRCKLVESSRTTTDFPNDSTFHTLLAGWARVAKLASKGKKATRSDTNKVAQHTQGNMPLRAEAWLDRMRNEHGIDPSSRAYSSILQVWSLSNELHPSDTVHCEEILRGKVWPLLQTTRQRHDTDAQGVVICTNIVFRIYSKVLMESGRTMDNQHKKAVFTKCLALWKDFLELIDEANVVVRPNNESLHSILNVIASPNTLTATQKHSLASNLVKMMKERHGIYPGKKELKKLNRMKRRHDEQVSST